MEEIQRSSQPRVRSKLRLSEVERLIKVHRVIVPPPSRQTLANMCEDGTLETAGRPTAFGWLVYEDSFWAWADSFDHDAAKRRDH